MTRHVGIAFLLLAASLPAQTNPTPASPPNNPELTQLYNEDQRVRQPQPLSTEKKASITRTDADRLAAVKQIIAHDQL